MVRIVALWMMAALLSGSPAINKAPSKTEAVPGEVSFATNRCYSKGGIGIIHQGLYIDLKSVQNELRLTGANRWGGKNAPLPEVVFFFQNKVWSQNALPEGFDISRAIIISFESDKVRFFDFSKMSGGYYLRMKPGS